MIHTYAIKVRWTGNVGAGTQSYRAYLRDHEIQATGKSQAISASSDPAFRGDPARWNPEELLVGSLSGCHMLWYLHLCADAGSVVLDYEDAASGTMETLEEGGGRFTEVLLRPRVLISRHEDLEEATRLHDQASRLCFIARSVKFPVKHEPTVTTTGAYPS